MRAAMETAESLGVPILLGDQDATVTSQNINKAFSLSDILRLASDPSVRSNVHLQRLTEEMRDGTGRTLSFLCHCKSHAAGF